MKLLHTRNITYFFIFLLFFGVSFFLIPRIQKIKYVQSDSQAKIAEKLLAEKEEEKPVVEKLPVTHIATPENVKGFYLSGFGASNKSFRKNVIDGMEGTEINTLIIDVKDYTGKIFFKIDDKLVNEIGSSSNIIADLPEFLAYLHSKNIYLIARISSFQDPYLAKARPDWAVKTLDGKTTWKDKKGISWVDPGNKEVWNYLATIAKSSYDIGFDEVNFDYIRFPSDGDMENISFPASGTTPKAEIIKQFFQSMDEKLRKNGIKVSADVFGMTTTNKDDLGIGQVFENIAPYVDYICPMVYPSHYPNKWNGFDVPAKYPKEVLQISTQGGLDKLKAINEPVTKMRPWIQDFSLGGVTYTSSMIKKQFEGINQNGINSYLVWNASNKYIKSAYINNQ